MKDDQFDKDLNRFLDICPLSSMFDMIQDFLPLVQLYNFDENDDWVKDELGKDDVDAVRFVRTVYLLSRFANLHSGKLLTIKTCFKDLHLKMEKTVNNDNN